MLQHTRRVQTHVAANTLAGSREVSRIEGTCPCGTVILIDYDDTVCACGRHYNLSGQELRPNWRRELVEEEGWDAVYGEDE